jgi:hypothetical protein
MNTELADHIRTLTLEQADAELERLGAKWVSDIDYCLEGYWEIDGFVFFLAFADSDHFYYEH